MEKVLMETFLSVCQHSWVDSGFCPAVLKLREHAANRVCLLLLRWGRISPLFWKRVMQGLRAGKVDPLAHCRWLRSVLYHGVLHWQAMKPPAQLGKTGNSGSQLPWQQRPFLRGTSIKVPCSPCDPWLARIVRHQNWGKVVPGKHQRRGGSGCEWSKLLKRRIQGLLQEHFTIPEISIFTSTQYWFVDIQCN